MMEFHRIRRATLGHRAQRGGVAKHLSQRDVSANNLAAVLLCHPLHQAATGGEIAHNVPGVLFRRFHLNVHDRLKNNRIRPPCALFEAEDRRHAEGHLRGVNVMVGTKRQGRFHIHHRIARQHSRIHGFSQAFFHRRDVLPRHHPAFGGIFKHKTTPGG